MNSYGAVPTADADAEDTINTLKSRIIYSDTAGLDRVVSPPGYVYMYRIIIVVIFSMFVTSCAFLAFRQGRNDQSQKYQSSAQEKTELTLSSNIFNEGDYLTGKWVSTHQAAVFDWIGIYKEDAVPGDDFFEWFEYVIPGSKTGVIDSASPTYSYPYTLKSGKYYVYYFCCNQFIPKVTVGPIKVQVNDDKIEKEEDSNEVYKGEFQWDDELY
mmetsp:Transcript_36033/g.36716  ORF Transcript_36033/g.36716 Transcript_36033/m.36716 type:complete len:213 (-) Transcript_36033:450-1088(-)